MELKICHLYCDVLNLYGDRGNMISMKKRLEWRGIDVRIKKLGLGQKSSLADCDLIFIGGGMEFDNALLAEDLRSGRAAELRAAVEDGVSLLAICSGFQLLGQYCEDEKARRTAMAGLLDMYTRAGEERMTGNYSFVCGDKSGGSEVIGFENHIGKTYLGTGLEPLGKILCGHGNNGEDGTEGVRYKNLFGSYSYGPLLPKNPALCDHILLTALERKYGHAELSPMEDVSEKAAYQAMSERLSK